MHMLAEPRVPKECGMNCPIESGGLERELKTLTDNGCNSLQS